MSVHTRIHTHNIGLDRSDFDFYNVLIRAQDHARFSGLGQLSEQQLLDFPVWDRIDGNPVPFPRYFEPLKATCSKTEGKGTFFIVFPYMKNLNIKDRLRKSASEQLSIY